MNATLVTAATVRIGAATPGDAVLIEDGRVTAVGAASELRRPGVVEVGHPGQVIVPGLRDAHFHPVTYTAAVTGTSLKTAASLTEVSARLQEAAAALAPGEPLVAVRLDDESLREGRLPTRRDLDAAVADRPVLVHRYCGHIAVANTAALARAGVDASTPDPAGGSLDRADDGIPTGVLRETAITMVASNLRGGRRPDAQSFVAAMEALASVGLTSIGAIVGCGDGPWATLGNELDVLVEAAADVPIRLGVFVIASSAARLEAAARKLDGAGNRVRFLGLKLFTDGSLGGHTALMHEPFADRPDESGTLRLDAASAGRLITNSLEFSERIAVHAIGDKANAIALDLYGHILDGGADPSRLRIEHASVLGPGELEGFVTTGVTASVQPAFLGSETTWLEKRLGAARMSHAYPFRTLAESGVPLAGGSDCPVEAPHPLAGIALARDRAGINPAEGLDATAALELFTSGAAAALAEAQPLAPGSPADLVILDRDPVASTPDEVRTTTVVETWVGGHRIAVPDDAVVWAG